MKEFELKNGSSASLEIWSINKIKDYNLTPKPYRDLNNMGDKSYVGFAFFGPSTAADLLRVDPDNNFIGRENLHRALVAKVGGEVVGIVVSQWVKFSLPFWHYHVRWIDVRSEYKNHGVGTNLAKNLNDAEFLKGKVLLLGMLTQEGENYISNVMKRELKAKDYTLVFEDGIPKDIKRFGKYGGKYWGR